MIEVLHLFPELNSSLIELLKGLNQEQWNRPTVCKQWTVKDIAAHLLDTALRRLSVGRDSHKMSIQIMHPDDLVNALNDLNASWVNAYKRISPEILIAQLSEAQNEQYEYLSGLDPLAPAMFPVSWAGESHSLQWFDTAREYTERWHHQQQIRLATGRGSVLNRDLYYPFLDICMQALPFHYRSMSSEPGTHVRIEVVGDAGGIWTIVRNEDRWEFTSSGATPDAQVYIDQNIAWLLFSKGIEVSEAAQYWQVFGDSDLGSHVLTMKAFVV